MLSPIQMQFVLHIFPLPQEHNSNNEEQHNSITKVSENQVILPTIPNAPIFPFSHVLDMNTHDNFLFDTIPHSVFNELVQGNDATIIIYDASSHNRFDTKIMLAFSDLFNLNAKEIFIQFNEFGIHGEIEDLIARDKDEGREYKVDNIDIIEKYYKFGVDCRTKGTMSIFSITLRQKQFTSKLNIVDLSGCSNDILQIFTESCIDRYNNTNIATAASPLYQCVQKSSSLLVIASASHLDRVTDLENTLSYISNIYEKTSFKQDNLKRSRSLKHKSSTTQNDDNTEYLRRIILKLTQELNTLRPLQRMRGSINTTITSNSASSSDHNNNEQRHASMFSSVSNSTAMTAPPPDPIYEEKVIISDLNRQIEELENQIAFTRERNTHVERELHTISTSQNQLLSIQEKQDCIIKNLEWKLEEMERLNDELYQKLLIETDTNYNTKKELERTFQDIQRGMSHLGNERSQLDQVLHIMENMICKGDKDISNTIQELDELKSISQQQQDKLKMKDEEIETLSYQLYHNNNIHTQRSIIKTIDSENSSEILFNQKITILESRVEELEEYIEHIRDQRDNFSDQLEERTDEVEKLKASLDMQAAKDTKILELEHELKSTRQIIQEGDYPDHVKSLEENVNRLQQERSHYISNASNKMHTMSQALQSQVHDIRRLKETIDKLNEQLDDTTSSYILKEQELLELQEEMQILKNNTHTSATNKRDSKQSFTTADLTNNDKSELAYWLYDKINDSNGGKSEVIRKFIRLADESSQFAIRIHDLENQLFEQQQSYPSTLTSYEPAAIKSTPSISSTKSRRKTKTGSAGSYSLLSYGNSSSLKQKSDRESLQSDASGLKNTPSRQSGNLMHRSTTPNLPPPGVPPNNPLPPVPMLPYIPNNNSTCPLPLAQQQHMASNTSFTTTAPVAVDGNNINSRTQHIAENDFKTAIEVVHRLETQLEKFQHKFQDQQHEIERLLDDQAALQSVKNQMNMTALELKNERALKVKAEKAHYILEKRMEELMNTKKSNKFRCF